MTQILSDLVPHNSVSRMPIFNHVDTNVSGISPHIQGYNQLSNASNVDSSLQVT